MKWNDFIEKLVAARKQGCDKKISVPALAILIFSGAFDSFLDDGVEPSVEVYQKMFQELLKARGSKASLPKKKKGQSIGLAEVKTMLQLTVWRSQCSPIVKKIDFAPIIAPAIEHYGFRRVNKPGSIFSFSRAANRESGRPEVLGTAEWGKLFSDDSRLAFFEAGRLLMVFGVVTDARVVPYGPQKDKERLVFRIFTGTDTTDEIVLWPSRSTGRVSEALKHDITDGNVCYCLLKPSKYKDKPTGTVSSFVKLPV